MDDGIRTLIAGGLIIILGIWALVFTVGQIDKWGFK